MKQIIEALLNAQQDMSNAVKSTTNPFFKSKYADLNSVREATIPLLNKNKIVVLQPMVHLEGKNFVKTILLHESGESIESFTEILFKQQNDAQAQGSGITYARRYGLQSLLCIGADDDDGNCASTEQKAKKQESNVLNFAKQQVQDYLNNHPSELTAVLNFYHLGSIEDFNNNQYSAMYNDLKKKNKI